MSKKIAFVTGATGYLGANLVRHLLISGWSVTILVREKSSFDLIGDLVKKIRIMIYDGSYESVSSAIILSQPTMIFHLASLFISEHRSAEVTNLIESNIRFPSYLLEAAVSMKVPYFINTSTSWQHYDNQEYNPANLYASTKQAFEDIIQYYVQVSSLNVISLVIFDTYGPKDPRRKIINLLLQALKNEESLDMSPGNQQIDLVYVDDVVAAYEAAAMFLVSEVSQHYRYGVSSGFPVTLKELVIQLEKISRRNLSINWGGRPYRNREIMKPWDSYFSLPNWEPAIKLSDGLKIILVDKNII